MELVIIILNWNKPDLTCKAIESVQFPAFIKGTILVADNGSSDDSLKVFHQIPQVNVLALERNYGFAQGYNLAVNYARKEFNPRYLFLLNNDAQLEEKAIEYLYRDKDRGHILCPKIFFSDRITIWACGGELRLWQGWAGNIGLGEIDRGQYDRGEGIDFASGCALWINSEVLNKVPLFSPEFGSYFEDVDFCYRARRAGFGIWFIPEARVVHEVSQTGGDEYELGQSRIRWRNRLLMVLRNGRRTDKILFPWLILPLVIVRDSWRYLRLKKVKELAEAFRGLGQLPG